MKIKKLNIESFRGIPCNLTIDFTNNKGKPCSTLIFGDNGSGKSSIIDALEFNLQGKIERSDSLNNEFRPFPVNLKNEVFNGSSTLCIFDDGSENMRNIIVEYDPILQKNIFSKSNSEMHSSFMIAPIVLRRSDIINYSVIPTQKKQILFWSFIYKTNIRQNDIIPDNTRIQELYKQRVVLKSITRKKILEDLSIELKVPVDEIPLSENEIETYKQTKILKNISNKQYSELKNKSRIKGINERALKLIEKHLSITREIKKIESNIAKLKKIESSPDNQRKSEIQKFLSEASKSLTHSFHKTSTTDFVNRIDIKISHLTDVSFDIDVELKNGKITSPNNIFSEANLDLLILLLYTSIIKESTKYGQAKIIVLDDVLQSVDSVIRLNFLHYLLTNFRDWQIIITVHDRLWLNQLRSAFKRLNFDFKEIEIYRWNFDIGPQLIESQLTDVNSALKSAIESNNVQLIASQTGLFFELICHNLSMSINASIQRKIEDRYNIGDLWPSIKKILKNTSVKILCDEIDKTLHIRNLLGAHYNEWAISLSNSEIIRFSDDVNKLFQLVYCVTCQSWISDTLMCKCKNIIIKK